MQVDAFIARQPIFDKNMEIFGYELLYRQNENNFFAEIDDDQATKELIYNTFLVMGLQDLTDGTVAFINFSKGLIDSAVPFMLPKQNIVVEVLERQQATSATVSACSRLKEQGYQLALDDFVLDQSNEPLIGMCDIIKVEFPVVSREEQAALIEKYGKKLRFLAEKIETREEYAEAVKMGYDLFQGYFFSRPAIVKSREVVTLNANLVSIFRELNSPDPSYAVIANIFEEDLGLSYKLLKLANSVYMEAKNRIKSIPHALTYIGIRELKHWISLMMLKEMQNVENAELIKQSLIRGKFMELIAAEMYPDAESSEFYFTGIFSSMDILLGRPMEEVVQGLPISSPVKDALLGKPNAQRRMLDFVIDWENARWKNLTKHFCVPPKVMNRYVESLKWAQKLNY